MMIALKIKWEVLLKLRHISQLVGLTFKSLIVMLLWEVKSLSKWFQASNIMQERTS